MSSSGLAETPAEARRLRVIGVVYLLVVAGLVWLSIASYQHAFSDHVTVTVEARDAGQQLNVGGDVRMNGAIVGRVSDVSAHEDGATVELQIDDDAAERIPTDVVARILPTTLFGQKFVELRSTSDPAQRHLADGAVVAEDRSAETVELTRVIDELDRVIRSVRTDQLSATLGALAGGLDGRGERLGRLMTEAGGYLHALNQDTPLIEADLALLASVAGQYADAAPAFLATTRNATVTARALTEEADTWSAFLAAVSDASADGGTLLEATRRNLEESARLSRPTLELLAEYSPQIVCNIEGFLKVESQSADQIRDHSFQGHFTMGAQAGGYTEDDRLVLGDLGTGPSCRGLPKAPIPYPPVDLDDGVEDAGLLEMLGVPGGAR